MSLKDDYIARKKVKKIAEKLVYIEEEGEPVLAVAHVKSADSQVKKAFRECKSTQEMARKLGMSLSYAYYRLRVLNLKYRLKKKYNDLNPTMKKDILSRYKGVVKMHDLSRKYNIAPYKISSILHEQIRVRIEHSRKDIPIPKNLWEVKIANETLDDPTFLNPQNVYKLANLINCRPVRILKYFNIKTEDSSSKEPRSISWEKDY